jgi:hypothetical protein
MHPLSHAIYSLYLVFMLVYKRPCGGINDHAALGIIERQSDVYQCQCVVIVVVRHRKRNWHAEAVRKDSEQVKRFDGGSAFGACLESVLATLGKRWHTKWLLLLSA